MKNKEVVEKDVAIVKEVKKDIVVRMPQDVISEAIAKGANLEQIEKLMLLQEKWEANEARKAYHVAMAQFKTEAIEILKDAKVDYATKTGGRVKYNHASLANVISTVTPLLSKYGLSISWKPLQTSGNITITTMVTHALGHREEFSLTGPADDSGGKNSLQAIGSTASYLERYGTLAALGLATGGQDDDGQAAEVVEYITDKERSELTDLAIDCKADMPKFMDYLKVEDLTKLPKADFAKAKLALIAKKAKK